jgi:hypothetical protein
MFDYELTSRARAWKAIRNESRLGCAREMSLSLRRWSSNISFQLAQVLGQHLLGGPRNDPSELTKSDRTRPHGTENLKFPFSLEQDFGSQSGTPDVS